MSQGNKGALDDFVGPQRLNVPEFVDRLETFASSEEGRLIRGHLEQARHLIQVLEDPEDDVRLWYGAHGWAIQQGTTTARVQTPQALAECFREVFGYFPNGHVAQALLDFLRERATTWKQHRHRAQDAMLLAAL